MHVEHLVHGIRFEWDSARSDAAMNMSDLARRLRRERPMVAISLRIPEDVLADLKRVAPELGFSGYQPLMKAYIGQGLREDLAKLEQADALDRFVASLKRRGVDQKLIEAALADLR
jgi:ABC-type amino acid transport substrate-binding protein